MAQKNIFWGKASNYYYIYGTIILSCADNTDNELSVN